MGPSGYFQEKTASEQVEQLIDTLYRRKWTIILVFVLIVGAFTAYTYSRTAVYRADALVMLDLSTSPQANNSSSGQLTDVSSDQFFSTNTRTMTGEIFLLENSEAVAHRVARRLVNNADSLASRENLSLSILRTADGSLVSDVDNVAARLPGYVSIQQAHVDINALRVMASSPVQGEASFLANLYAQEYVELTQVESRSQLVSKRKFLEEQEQERLKELQAIEDKISDYRVNHGVTENSEIGTGLVSKIADLEAQRDDAQLQLQQHRATLKSLQERVSQFDQNVTQGIAASGLERRIEGVQEKIAQLEMDKEEIYLQYPELRAEDTTNQNLEQLNGQISQLEQEVDRLTQQYVERVEQADNVTGANSALASLPALKSRIYEEESAISQLNSKINVIEDRLEDYRAQLKTVPGESMELMQLERQRAYAERMHQLVVERLQETRVAEESEPGYAHVLQPASIAAEPVRPNAMRYLLVGCFLGLLFGVGMAIVLDKLDNRIYKPDQLVGTQGNVLGVIPEMRKLIRDNYDGQEYVDHHDHRVDTALVSLLKPNSSVSEAYRHVRTRLRHGGRDHQRIKSVIVTSAGMKDGKSVTASNLAVTLAQSGQRTILIDGDLRRPRIHEIFDLSLGPGLVQLTSGDAPEGAIREVMPNLHVLTAGEVVGNAAELLESHAMHELFAELHNRYDCVVVDTPPSLVVTDATVLSTYCDGILVVCRAGQTREKEVDEVMETFEEVGSRVVGVLLNGFDVSSAYGQKYKYRHYADDLDHGSYFDDDQPVIELREVEGDGRNGVSSKYSQI